MKLVVIGFGQCGNRIADDFARLNKRARRECGIEIVTGAFAVNTDAADLSGLDDIKADYQHRILIGAGKTSGHGVGKINDLAFEIIKEDMDKVFDAIRSSQHFHESDAFLLIAGAAGGTGSGVLGFTTQRIRERYGDKPVYNLIVLPFEHEETTEERTIYNTATCLKTASTVADAVILVDNQRYIKKDFSLRNNVGRINALVVEPFYNILCAGEEKRSRHVGTRVLDGGDILQTLAGWTAIGYGQSALPRIRLPFGRNRNFLNKSTESHRGIQAMDQALSELSITCNTVDASRALYLLSAPANEMSMDLVKELSDALKSQAPNAIIRNGDYPRGTGIDVTVIFSGLRNVERVKDYYDKSAVFMMSEVEKKSRGVEERWDRMEESGKNIPALL
jgi:cell division GTPase FtsZ